MDQCILFVKRGEEKVYYSSVLRCTLYFIPFAAPYRLQWQRRLSPWWKNSPYRSSPAVCSLTPCTTKLLCNSVRPSGCALGNHKALPSQWETSAFSSGVTRSRRSGRPLHHRLRHVQMETECTTLCGAHLLRTIFVEVVLNYLWKENYLYDNNE